jgi:hypothetical protein
VCARVSSRVLSGALLLLCAGCGGSAEGAERFELYHLETAIGRPGADGELRCGPPRAACPGVLALHPRRSVRYEVLDDPELEEDGIDRAGIEADGELVMIPFTAEGTAAFGRLTREVARYGGRDQGWHHIAVVVGDEIVAFPEVDFDQFPNGIPNAPSLQLTTGSAAEARDLVERLRDG